MEETNASLLYYHLAYTRYYKIFKEKHPDEVSKKWALTDIIPSDLRRKLRVLYAIIKSADKESINIFSEEGTKVVHNGHVAAMAKNLEENAVKYLRKDWVYTVKTCLAYSSHTLVETQEFPGVLFNAHAFSPLQKISRSIEDLLQEYGPDFETDLQEAINLQKERNAKTSTDKLMEIYEAGKKSGCFGLLIDHLPNFMEVQENRPPKYLVDDQFDDAARLIKVLSVSDCPDEDGIWYYFIQYTEHDGSGTWYQVASEKLMDVFNIVNTNNTIGVFSKDEQIIRDITRLHGGALSGPEMPFPATQCLQLVQNPKYEVGQIVKDKEILFVSPTLNYSGEWCYFCKIAFNPEYFDFLAIDEEGVAFSLEDSE